VALVNVYVIRLGVFRIRCNVCNGKKGGCAYQSRVFQ